MKYRIETGKNTTKLVHYWETCVGSCHGTTALRSDYREQLKQAHEELGFTYVRFHGLFDDDMSVVLCDSPSPYMPSEQVKYNFMNTDNIFDFLVEIGMKPFIELGFMPKLLASGDATTMKYLGNITPPKSYGMWSDFMEAFAAHLEERYGEEEVATWFFEVWNEPNLDSFWTGGKEEYFKLYEASARAIKKINEKYQVGGPATSINAWIPEFRAFCDSNHVPLDFISTHHYPTDDPMWNNPDMNLTEILTEKGMNAMNQYDKHIMRKMTERAKKESGDLPLYYTEWNISAMMGDPEHDTPYAAATIARIIHENIGMTEGYSWWTFSDIFEEMGQMLGEFQGGFGLQTYHGIKKPAYRLFELMHALGNQQYDVSVLDGKEDGSIGVLATKDENRIAVLIYNQNTKALDEIEKEQVILQVPADGRNIKAAVARIDETHANARRIWEEMGAPDYVNQEQLAILKEASALRTEELNVEIVDGMAQVLLEMPEYSVAYLELKEA